MVLRKLGKRGAKLPPRVLSAIRGVWTAVERVRPEHMATLQQLTERVLAELQQKMKRLASGRYTTVATAAKRIQLQALAERIGVQLGTDMGDELEAMGRFCAEVARSGLADEVNAWIDQYPGATNLTAAPDLASDLLDEGLLEHYAVSRRTYGMQAIGAMRQEMAAGALTGEPLINTWQRISERLSLDTARAERIVRTEHSFAVHQRQLADMREMFPGDMADEWEKQLVATLDNRTGEDSIFVNGQTRPLDEPFEDNEGRVYMMPPNRPNDREVVIFVPGFAPRSAHVPG